MSPLRGSPPARQAGTPSDIEALRKEYQGLEEEVRLQWKALHNEKGVPALQAFGSRYAALRKRIEDELEALNQRPGTSRETLNSWTLLRGNVISAGLNVTAAFKGLAEVELRKVVSDQTRQSVSDRMQRFYKAWDECRLETEALEQGIAEVVETYAKVGDEIGLQAKHWANAELRETLLYQTKSAAIMLQGLIHTSRGLVVDETGAFTREPQAFQLRLTHFVDDMERLARNEASKKAPAVAAAILQRAANVCRDLQSEAAALGNVFEGAPDEYAFKSDLQWIGEAVRLNLELAAATIAEDANEYALQEPKVDPGEPEVVRQARVIMEQQYPGFMGPGFYPEWSEEELKEVQRSTAAPKESGRGHSAKAGSQAAGSSKAARAQARKAEAPAWAAKAESLGLSFAEGVPGSVRARLEVANGRIGLVETRLREPHLENLPSEDWLGRRMNEASEELDTGARLLRASLRDLRDLLKDLPAAPPAGAGTLRKQLRQTEKVLCEGLSALLEGMKAARAKRELLMTARNAKSFLAEGMPLTEKYVVPLHKAGLMSVRPHVGERFKDSWGYGEEREVRLCLPPAILEAMGGEELLRHAPTLRHANAQTLFDKGEDKIIVLGGHNHFSARTGGMTTAMHTKLWQQRKDRTLDAAGQPVIRTKILFPYTMQRSLEVLRQIARG